MQSNAPAAPTLFNSIIILLIFSLCVMAAFILATENVYWVTGAILGVSFFAIGFLSPTLALYILIFSMLLSPEFGSRDTSGQGFTIRFEDLLLIVMSFAWLAKSAIHKNIGLALYTKLNTPIFLYTLACTIATTWGILVGTVNPATTGIMFVMKYVEYYVVFFLTTNIVTSKRQLKLLLGAMFITYIIVLLLGFSQIPQGQRISAPFEGEGGEPNTLGGYIIIMLSLNIMLFLNASRKIYRVLLGMLGTIAFVALLYTLSRASWLGFAGMYISLIILTNKRKLLIFALMMGLLAAPFLLPDIVVDRILYTFQKDKQTNNLLQQYSLKELEQMYRTGKVGVDTSTQARFDSMRQALRDFQKKPIFGYGVTGYYFLDAQFHRVLIETGLVGLMAFLYLLWMTGHTVFGIMKKYSYDPFYNAVTVSTMAAFIGLVLHSIGTNTFIIVRIMEPFWCLVGLNIAIQTIEEADEEPPPRPQLLSRPAVRKL